MIDGICGSIRGCQEAISEELGTGSSNDPLRSELASSSIPEPPYPGSSLSGLALTAWGFTSQSTVLLGEVVNFLDGGQGTTITDNLTRGIWTSRPAGKAVKGLGRASNLFSALSYGFVAWDWSSDVDKINMAYESGAINEDLYRFYTSAANGEGVFNGSMNTIGLVTGPGGGVAIGITQASTSYLAEIGLPSYDSGVAAGQLWAIATAGDLTFTNGKRTTGFRMLTEGFGWAWVYE
jgi:hypothetical protein